MNIQMELEEMESEQDGVLMGTIAQTVALRNIARVEYLEADVLEALRLRRHVHEGVVAPGHAEEGHGPCRLPESMCEDRVANAGLAEGVHNFNVVAFTDEVPEREHCQGRSQAVAGHSQGRRGIAADGGKVLLDSWCNGLVLLQKALPHFAVYSFERTTRQRHQVRTLLVHLEAHEAVCAPESEDALAVEATDEGVCIHGLVAHGEDVRHSRHSLARNAACPPRLEAATVGCRRQVGELDRILLGERRGRGGGVALGDGGIRAGADACAAAGEAGAGNAQREAAGKPGGHLD
eukprot:CAMPEP_0204243426 /NCGR_PEP_ID=MMETSP0361-20130328/96406_1 /ASSEMBLY_ACC=CAM_ASM_000343 /TAXON_ID=268821 /ORGANISM="Scrippsiella Hangoei, Strain SHTV-5" /LENGTH=291 /DNA_ID=CAMNT_0051216281 /DNA_START=339 /DNA_END=1210 /DNA_ORIENTATION=-